MKWVIIGLFSLGLAAAVCAAVLVASLQSDQAATGPVTEDAVPEATVLVANRDLRALTVVDAECVSVRRVSRDAAPAAAMTDPVQAVGRVLLTSVEEGQALTPDAFISDASTARLAASLSPGFRAVNVALSDTMGVERLLIPGSVVDVLASIEVSNSTEGSRQEPVSITLLQGVRVLAVGDRTIVAPERPADAPAEPVVTTRERPMVTLLVSALQAEKLKLAMQKGSVTLAVRNPIDEEHVDAPGSDLASLSPLLVPKPAPEPEKAPEPAPPAVPEPPVAAAAPAPVAVAPPPPPPPPWETVILRGGVTETRSFPPPGTARDQ